MLALAASSAVNAAIFLSGSIDFENVNGRLVFRLDPAKDLPKNPADWPGGQIPKTPGTYEVYLGNGASAQITISKAANGDDITSWKIIGVTDGWKVYSTSRDEYDTNAKAENELKVQAFDDGMFRLDLSNPFEPVFIPLNLADPGLLNFWYETRPVPETATWLMMVGGFGTVGGALRYRRKGTASWI
jgi:hypothetical protein